jgi:hypothetical protein
MRAFLWPIVDIARPVAMRAAGEPMASCRSALGNASLADLSLLNIHVDPDTSGFLLRGAERCPGYESMTARAALRQSAHACECR